METLKKFNISLLILPVLIFSIGFITLLSAVPDKANTQLIFFVVSFLFYLGVSVTNYRLFQAYTKQLLLFSLVLLLVTYVLGVTVFGSERWLAIGAFSFQPSEIAKLALILFIPGYICARPSVFNNIAELGKMLLFVIPLFVLVFLQPDLGTALILVGITLGVLFYAGLNKLYFVATLVVVGLLSSPLWQVLKDYQKVRILVFLNPTLDVLGSGYNVIQSLIAVGSGGFLGKGFGHGSQAHLNYLPVFWTDFIFASFSEEWGFIGVAVFLVVYILLLGTLLYIAYKIKDSFGTFIVIGVFFLFFIQFIINVGMNLGLLPVTGITLPLVSYGGSSLVVSLILLGFVQSVWVHKNLN